MDAVMGLAWYWLVLITVAWLLVCLVLLAIAADAKRTWPWVVVLGAVFLGLPAWAIVWSWTDEDAPRSQCEDLGGIVVVTPANGRACIDRSAVIPEDEWNK